MKIAVLRDNELVSEIDLGKETAGNGGSSLIFLLGRSAECHVQLDDKQVSRVHAEISYQGGNWSLKSTSEFSSIRLNGTSTTQSILSEGDLVSVGPFILQIIDVASLEQTNGVEDDTSTNDPYETRTILEKPPVEAAAPIEEVLEVVKQPIRQEEIKEDNPDEQESVLAESFSDSDFESFDATPVDSDGTSEFDLGPATSEEFSSAGAKNSEFTGQNDQSVFPDDNSEEIEEFGDFGVAESDEDAEGGYDDESTKVFQSFAKFQLEIFGENAPYDKFNLEKHDTLIGRDASRCDIVLNDPEVSSLHAKITKNNVTCTIEDLQSGNGTLLNGERINKSPLTNGDEFIIGSTTFTVKIVSDFIDEERDRMMPVEENQVVEVQEIVEVDEEFDDGETELDGDAFGASGPIKNQSLVEKFKAMPPVRKILVIVVVLGALLMLVDEEEGAKKSPVDTATKPAEIKVEDSSNPEVVLSVEQLEQVESSYQLASELISRGLFREALLELDKNVMSLIPNYKSAAQYREVALQGIQEAERIEEARRKRILEEERKAKVVELVARAKTAVAERNIPLSESLFAEIAIIDPNNFDISSLKIELDAWKKEQERIALDKAQKEAERQRMVGLLQPGKTFYLRKEWYNATVRLEEFLQVEKMDEDLVAEATKMLQESKTNLNNLVGPLLGRARSLYEGQDLKGAYENYNEVLKHEPTSAEALNEMNDIREILHARSRKVYREAIISESLSLFQDAKEKFQEVQQISPSDSEYYQKATDKLKDYID